MKECRHCGAAWEGLQQCCPRCGLYCRFDGHLPSPDDIREECRKIQEGWTRRQERERRSEVSMGDVIPVVSTARRRKRAKRSES